jgi:hypothetical protein
MANLLRAPKPIMKQTLTVALILRSRIPPALRQRPRQIRFRQPLPARARRLFQQVFHKLQIRFSLIRLKCHIAPRQARIMFNRIMLAEFREIKRAGPVAAVQEICREGRHEETEGGREIEGLAHGGVEVAEGDVFTVVREDGVVGKCVEHGTGGARVTGAWRRVFRPFSCVPGCVSWNDGVGLVRGEYEVQEEYLEVPSKDE